MTWHLVETTGRLHRKAPDRLESPGVTGEFRRHGSTRHSTMHRLTTTTELLAALRRGCGEPEWEVFVERYRPILLGVAHQLGLGPEDAADAVQQTLLEFVRDYRGYDRGRGRLRSWVLGILRHRAMDLHRLRARDRHDAARQVLQAPSEVDRLDAVWQEQLERRILEEALEALRRDSHLSPSSIRAFELTALRGVPVEQAAAECGMSVNAVYTARSRLADRLRTLVASIERTYAEEE